MNSDARQIYTGDAYVTSQPTWHAEDSPWKAAEIAKLLRRNKLRPRRIADIGCGAGGVLRALCDALDGPVQADGFDISPHAIGLAKPHESATLRFHCEDLLADRANTGYDLLLCIDVFEHVEDYMGFLRKLATRARYVVFHIPLDMNIKGLLRNNHLRERSAVGHLHYFDAMTARLTLQDTGYTVVDQFYTHKKAPGLIFKSIDVVQKLVALASGTDFAVKLLGGDHALLVLAYGSAGGPVEMGRPT